MPVPVPAKEEVQLIQFNLQELVCLYYALLDARTHEEDVPVYGYGICQRAEDDFGLTFNVNTVYRALEMLEDTGLLQRVGTRTTTTGTRAFERYRRKFSLILGADSKKAIGKAGENLAKIVEEFRIFSTVLMESSLAYVEPSPEGMES